DWFAVDGAIEVDDVKVTLAALLAAVRTGKRFVRAAGGDLVALGDELRGRLVRLDGALVEERGKLLAGPPAVEVVGSVVEDESQRAAAKEWVARRARWAAARRFEPTVPRKLRATLRPYQEDGHAWLARLAACGVAGCLADDMGLGKTLQALALLVTRAAEGPALVVAPTSVTGNWESEAARFAPSLRVAIYRGAGRARHLAKLGARDVVVCSYDILVRDAEALAAIRFATIVFDEAHALKNS